VDCLSSSAENGKLPGGLEHTAVTLAVFKKKSRNCLWIKKNTTGCDREAVMGPFNLLIRIGQHNFRVKVALVKDGPLVGCIVPVVPVLGQKLS
jgi:hypothetical protein